MGAFKPSVVTEKGKSLIVKSMSGIDVEFTKIALSEERLTGDVTSFTDIGTVKQEAKVASVVREDKISIKASAVFSNQDLTTGYYIRNIGLYANDPDEGEILYSVSIADESVAAADWMPPFATTVTSLMVDMITTVSDLATINLTVDPTAFVTVTQFNALKSKVESGNLDVNLTVPDNVDFGSKGTVGNYGNETILEVKDTTDSTKRRYITLANATLETELSKALALVEVDGDTYNTKKIFHEGNIPTAEQVGAIQQGGGVGQNTNAVYIGWNGTNLVLKATVDGTDLGEFVFTGDADKAILPIAKGGTGALTAEQARSNLGVAPASHTHTAKDLSGVVPSSETSEYNFTNKSLNTVNIDDVTGYNYVTAISDDEHGTRPTTGWVNVVNFWSNHFVTQLAFSCAPSTDALREMRMWIRERYMSESEGWSGWKLCYNDSIITAGTTDLTAGSSALPTGHIYQMYE